MSNRKQAAAVAAPSEAGTPVKGPGDGKPVILGRGRYAIYQSPNGDGVISYRPDGEDADQHQVVPAKFWSILTGMLSGQVKALSPVEIVKLIMGAGK
jgi:hypothetical protein